MRIAKNRVIETMGGFFQLKNCPRLKFKKNQKYKLVKASYKGMECYFIAFKRNGRNGTKETVFFVSNVERSAKEHVAAYNKRWTEEKCFRTSKTVFRPTRLPIYKRAKAVRPYIFSYAYICFIAGWV